MKAIIIAAGQGSRLRPHTAKRPKCMVEINGRSLLERQIDGYRAAGIEDIVVIRGYRRKQIQLKGVRYIDNIDYKNNNILESLFTAEEELTGDVIVSYGDIVYHPDIAKALVAKTAPIMVVVDLDWKQIYEGREDHPISEGELCKIEMVTPEVNIPDGQAYRVAELGKHVKEEDALGEFIGLAKFSAAAAARLCAYYKKARIHGANQPFMNAPSLRKAYLTDLLNYGIRQGEFIHPFYIKGGWREIDTVQDYERAQESVTW